MDWPDIEKKNDGYDTPVFWKASIWTTILVDIGLWFLLKGTSFVRIVDWVAALGMGYYTLQIIGYTIDCYWGAAKAQKNPLKLLLFMSFFPQMITGPISRYRDLEHIYDGQRFANINLAHGAQRILWGFFKKLVIAEGVGVMVDVVSGKNLNLIIFGVLVLVIAAVLRERHGYARVWLDKQPLVFQCSVYIMLLFIIILYCRYGRGFKTAEFIYGGF